MKELAAFRSDKVNKSLKDICKCVVVATKISTDSFLKSSSDEAVDARHLAMYLCKDYTIASAEDVANFFDVSTHTIKYAAGKIKRILSDDKTSNKWLRDAAAQVVKRLSAD